MFKINSYGNIVPIFLILGTLAAMSGFAFYTGNEFENLPESFNKNQEIIAERAIDLPETEEILMNSENKKGQLTDVSGGNSSGTAYILRTGGKLYHMVSADLPELENGYFYEGWLVEPKSHMLFFSTGAAVKQSNGKYMVTYNATNEYRGYDFVVITKEIEDDQKPEQHILEGTVQ